MSTTELLLPPAYRLVTPAEDQEPFAAALAASGSAEDGDIFWCDRPDRLEMAVLLHPELPIPQACALAHVAMVGLGDAVGASAPPIVGVEFGWPDRLIVNGALAGGIRLATDRPEDTGRVPAWQVLGITVAIVGDPRDTSPGLRPEVTSLHDEGAIEITPSLLVENFSRHFLAWVHRWQEEGFAPVCNAWLSRALGYREAIDWRLHDGPATGRFVGLDDQGGLLLAEDEARASRFRTIALCPALNRANWDL